MSRRRRLDLELIRRGLASTREQAQAAVAAGEVLVGGTVADKASRLVGPSEAVYLSAPSPRFVSRGGLKLDAALARFSVDVSHRRALDAGASTGGFTDCLLQRGAATVVAVDVGRGQLHARLIADPRVDSRERTDIRDLTICDVGGEPVDVVVADLSFISLRTVAAALVGELSAPGADVVVLIKPQFEVGRRAAAAGRGVIRDPALWSEAILGVLGALAQHRAAMMGLMVSPLTGADGNVEFLAHLRAHEVQYGDCPPSVAAAVADAVAQHGTGHGSGPGNGPGTGRRVGRR